jgi:hypothetical protein
MHARQQARMHELCFHISTALRLSRRTWCRINGTAALLQLLSALPQHPAPSTLHAAQILLLNLLLLLLLLLLLQLHWR